MAISSSSPKPIRTLIVDDSKLMREILSEILKGDPEIEVVGTANDPFDAREKIKALNPDVITLDINMPRMDGLSFLEKIMTLRPMPVLMISSLTEKGARETFEALELGAVDYITKPTTEIHNSFFAMSTEICTKVKIAAKTNIKARTPSKAYDSTSIVVDLAKAQRISLVAIGSSTGGVEALTKVLTCLPETCPPILITQHMPPKFTASFAARLDKTCKPKICEAEDGHFIERGTIYIAPGDRHLLVVRKNGRMAISLSDEGNVSGHKPSVDVLFSSVAEYGAHGTLGIILTGMGRDGAKGLKKMLDAGAKTYGQNEETALIYGMPRAAKEIGAVEKEIPLKKVASVIMGVD